MATLAPSLKRLFADIDRRWPHRDHWSDGWLGDTSHQARFSDHNPDGRGIVHAIDVDATLTHAMGPGTVGDAVFASLIKDCRSGRLRNVVHYLIYRGHIYESEHGYAAFRYTGINQHESHVHVSIHRTSSAERWSGSWGIGEVPRIWADKTVKAFTHPLLVIAPLSVARVQLRLVAWGWLKAPYLIGRPGRKTRDALKGWQAKHEFKPDAIPGETQLKILAGDAYRVV